MAKAGAMIVLALVLGGCLAGHRDSRDVDGDWPTYGNDPGGTRYSPLAQIDRGNVGQLRVAWTYRTGEMADGAWASGRIAFEATPILVDGTLYLSTPFGRVIALDPETGAERWTFDPNVDRSSLFVLVTSRGVSSWLDPAAADGRACRRRIFVGTLDARLIALDAATGSPCQDFGRGGEVNLAEGIAVGRDCRCYFVTSPPAIVNGLVVIGSTIGDNRAVSVERGLVRAYDGRTGALRWTWDPIPTSAADPAAATWAGESWRRNGAANVWSVMSVDHERGLIFAPTSSPSPDFYGGERLGTNDYANSVVALRAATGEVVWHFQSESRNWGSPNMGGALTTAGGLVFIGAARDTKLRAFDVETGKVLWEAELPASAQATPMSYRSRSGKQFVVVAAGGHGVMQTKLGDHVVAFALP